MICYIFLLLYLLLNFTYANNINEYDPITMRSCDQFSDWNIENLQIKPLQNNSLCIDIVKTNIATSNIPLELRTCNITNPNQQWFYNSTSLTISSLNLDNQCLDAYFGGLTLFKCDSTALSQKFQLYNNTSFKLLNRNDFCLSVKPLSISLPCIFNSTQSFCNETLSYDERIDLLLNLLTIDEKIGLLGNKVKGIKGIIPEINYWNEGLKGLATSPGISYGSNFTATTSFPQIIGLAASFNKTLYYDIAKTIGIEGRSLSNHNRAGLTYFTPNINIARDVRWGRMQETCGESVYLTKIYAIHYIAGIQGYDIPSKNKNKNKNRNDDDLLVSACCKHAYAYDLETNRDSFDAILTKQDIADTYNIPFEACIKEAGSSCVMCAYNAVNGIPNCVNKDLLIDTIRNKYNLNGYIVTDCGAIDDVLYTHKYTNNTDQTVQLTLQNGINIECGNFLQNHTKQAYNNGIINELDIDLALKDSLKVQFRLGIYNSTYFRYNQLNTINTKEHQELAQLAAEQSFVLLKNNHNILPLSKNKYETIALLGPNSNVKIVQLGNYYGLPPFVFTILDGLQMNNITVLHENGCDINTVDNTNVTKAMNYAKQADITLLVMGLNQTIESETIDRTNLLFPGIQLEFITKISRVSNGPVIVILMNASPIDISLLKESDDIDAILWIGYPGQAGGIALYNILYGIQSPSGKLPYQIYYHDKYKKLDINNMNFRPSKNYNGRTYRFYTDEVVYPFGYGLSYTTFTYKAKLTSNKFNQQTISFTLNILIKNIGKRSSDQIILLYLIPPNAGKNGLPLKFLYEFTKIYLTSQEIKSLTFMINEHDLLLADKNGNDILDTGLWQIEYGNHQYISFNI